MAEPRTDPDMADVTRLYADIGAALATIRQIVARELPDRNPADVVQEDANSFLARRLAEPAPPVPLAAPQPPAPAAAAEMPQPAIVQTVSAQAAFAWPAWSAVPPLQPPMQAQADPAPEAASPPHVPTAADGTALIRLPFDDSLRDALREMIREELHGEMGARFSANLRAVIRREVAQTLDDRLLHG
nr:hypothetical protein [Paracoccus saliphilus]